MMRVAVTVSRMMPVAVAVINMAVQLCWEVLQLQENRIRLMLHIPNGGYRKPSDAARFRAMGVQAVVHNIFTLVPRGGYQGLWIAVKRRRGGRVSGEQARWMDALKKQGYACTVCYSWDEVFTVIQSYMRGDGICESERR